MEKVLNSLKVGKELTTEDVQGVQKLIKQLEEAEDNYERVKGQLDEAEQELNYFHQKETDDFIQWVDERDQREREHFIELNSMYE